MPRSFTPEEIAEAGLAPAEIAALTGAPDPDEGDEGDEGEPAEPAARQRTEPDSHAPPDEVPAGLMDPHEDWDAPEQEPETQPEPATDESREEPEPEPAPEPAPALSFRPEDYEAVKKSTADIRAEDDALQQRYNDGEIDDDELKAQRDDIRTRYDDMLRRQARMESELERHEQAASQKWTAAMERFGQRGEAAARVLTDDTDIAALEKELQAVYESNPALDYDTMLDRAYKRMSAMDEERYPPLAAGKAADKPKPSKPAEDTRRRDVPTTLGDAPSAADDGVANSKFQRLDAMSADKLERELARMSERERQDYLEYNAAG